MTILPSVFASLPQMYIFLFRKCLDYIRLIILSIQLGSLFVLMICFCLKCFLPAFSRGCHCFVWDVCLNNMTFAYTRKKNPTKCAALCYCKRWMTDNDESPPLLCWGGEKGKGSAALRPVSALPRQPVLNYTETYRRRTLDRGGETGDLHTPSFPERQTAAAKKERQKWWECDINLFFPPQFTVFLAPRFNILACLTPFAGQILHAG